MKTAAKDFKMTELGAIPKDWEVKRLGELCGDYSYGVGAEALDYDGKNKYLRITDIDEISHRFVPNPLTSPSFCGEEHVVKDNDLLVARTGASVGKSYIYSRRDGRLIFAGFLMKANVNGADSRFVFYCTLTDAYKQWVLSESARSGQPGLNLTQLKLYSFALPPLPEQRKIAAALSDVDEMIAALEKLIEKKRKIKTGAMQRLLTGKTRLPGFKGAWVEKRLGEAFEFHSNNTFSRASMIEGRGQIYNIHYGDVLIRYGAVLDCNKTAIPSLDDAASSVCKRDFLKDGDVIIADTAEDATVGKAVEVINVGDRLIASGLHTIFLRPKEGTFALGWLGYYVNSTAFHDQLLPLITGIKVSSISKGSLMDTVLRCPPTLAEQKAIAKVLGDMDEEIAALEAELAKTRQLKQGMMQELLTGRVRLV